MAHRRPDRRASARAPRARASMLRAWARPGLLAACLCLLPTGPVLAQAGAPENDKPPVDFDGGLDTRMREESLHNLLDFDDDTGPDALGPAGPKLRTASDAQYFRVRHRAWGQLKLRSGARLYTRVTTEWRKYLSPYLTPQKTEIILDNLYVELPRPAGLPLTLRVGRQDIVRGDGFVLLEGGPGDGSRSIYHNAVLLGLEGEALGLGKSRLELLALRNPAWDLYTLANGPSDLQRALGTRKPLVENDETAFGAYITHSGVKDQSLEAYYLYKEEEADAARDPHLRLHTLGGRASGKLPWQLRYAAEGAYQFGEHEVACSRVASAEGCDCEIDPLCRPDHRSFGGQASLGRSFLALLRPTLEVGTVYLSGDDPDDTGHPLHNDRGWIAPFSRWPKWSELLIYTQIAEQGRVADWTNLTAFYASLTLTLAGDTKLSYAFYDLRAPQALTRADGTAAEGEGTERPWTPLLPELFGSGTDRGRLHQWKLSGALSPKVSGHFWVERFAPGDFYAAEHRDDAYFVRWELMWKL